MSATTASKVARATARSQQVDALRDGRRQRANTFRPKKGRGSYRRPQRSRGGYR
jgi:stalled ribosome alternative rescue factor ArfA